MNKRLFNKEKISRNFMYFKGPKRSPDLRWLLRRFWQRKFLSIFLYKKIKFEFWLVSLNLVKIRKKFSIKDRKSKMKLFKRRIKLKNRSLKRRLKESKEEEKGWRRLKLSLKNINKVRALRLNNKRRIKLG